MKPFWLKAFLLAAVLAPQLAGAQGFTPPPPPQCTLTATPPTIEAGSRSRLQWTSKNASRGTLTEVGGIAANSAVYVTPSKTTDYTATFDGPGGSVSCKARVTVVPFGSTGTINNTNSGGDIVIEEDVVIGEPEPVGPEQGSGPTTVTPNTVDTGGFPTGETVTNPISPILNDGGTPSGLVSCQGVVDCNFCTFVALIQKVINWMLAISVLVAAIMFAWAGILYFTALGKPAQLERAKNIFVAVAIGFVLALAGYLVVQTIVNAVVKQNFFANIGGNWNSVGTQCNQQRQYNASVQQWLGSSLPALSTGQTTPVGTNSGGTQTSGGGTSGTCANCTDIQGFAVKPGTGTTVDAMYNAQLAGLSSTLPDASEYRITEGYPPSSNAHADPCHYNGTCTDMNCVSGSCTVQQINTFQQAASSQGMCAVYEAPSCPTGIAGKCISPTNITAPHFSVYKDTTKCQ